MRDRIVVRIFTNYDVLDISNLLGTKETLLDGIVDLYLNKSGPADLVIVLNASRSIRWVVAPKNRIYKILQEPVTLNSFTHRFTYRHPSFFSRVYTHSPNPLSPREISSHGFLGSELVSDTELSTLLPAKSKLLSIVASTKAIFPGHKKRLEFVDRLLIEIPEIEGDLYGSGREKALTRKIDGLRDYMFSIAIENSSTPNYITEKFTDCIRAGVVPVYFGASNVGDYFPADSFVYLPLDDVNECFRKIRELSAEDYDSRKQAISEAQEIIQAKFTLGSFISDASNEVLQESRSAPRVFISLFALDSFFIRLNEVLDLMLKFIPGQIKSQLSKILHMWR